MPVYSSFVVECVVARKSFVQLEIPLIGKMFKVIAQWAYNEQGIIMKNGDKDLTVEKDEELEVIEDLSNGWFKAK